MTEPQPGDFAVTPDTPPAGDLWTVGKWLCGNGFRKYGGAVILTDYDQVLIPLPDGAKILELPEDQEGWLWSTGQIPLTDDQRNRIVAVAATFNSVRHSTLDYLALAAHRLGITEGEAETKAYVEDLSHMIGPQIIDYCYERAGVHLFNDARWHGYVHPDDLMSIIKHPEQIIVDKELPNG